MTLLLRMAVRNLNRDKRTNNVIGIIMAAGLVFVVVALSFIQGIKTNYENLILGTIAGDISISTDEDTFDYTEDQMTKLQGLNNVTSVAPRLYDSCYLINDETFATATCIGIDKYRDEQLVSNFSRKDNELTLSTNTIAITKQLAETLKVEVGDKIEIAFSSTDGQFEKKDITVSYIYEGKATNSAIESWAIMQIEDMRERKEIEGYRVSTLKVFAEDTVDLQALKVVIVNALEDEDFTVETWEENSAVDMMRTPNIYSAILLAFSGVLFVLISIGITSVLYAALLEKTREYGVMQTLGMKRGQVIFMNFLEMVILITVSMVVGTLICLSIIGAVNAAEIGISSEALQFTFGGNVLTLKMSLTNYIIPISFIYVLSICISSIAASKVTKIPILEAMNN